MTPWHVYPLALSCWYPVQHQSILWERNHDLGWPFDPHAICFVLVTCAKSTSARDKLATKTSLAVSSMEYCCCLFSESYIRRGLGSGSGHVVRCHYVREFPLLS